MLNHLHIENYALIRLLDISFKKGLTVITGETGAGKSILLGALSLLIGKKPQNTAFLQNDTKCIIEGEFDISNLKLVSFFQKNDIDYQDITLLRREINFNGKSRAFINDTPVTITLLSDFGEYLIDIHSQHQTLQLKKDNFKISLIDGFAQNADIRSNYEFYYKTYTELHQKHEELLKHVADAQKQQDYLTFLNEEFEHAQLKENEQDELESRLSILSHAEKIKTILEHTTYSLDENDKNVIYQLTDLKNQWQEIAEYKDDLKHIFERLDSCIIELKDLNTEILSINNHLEFDTEEINTLETRLNLIYNLEQKHHVQSIHELIEIQNDIFLKLQNSLTIEESLVQIKKTLEENFKMLQATAVKLSNSRRKSIEKLAPLIQKNLYELKMPKAEFQIIQSETNQYEYTGKDKFDFLFNANGNGPLSEIKEVASGGEMSRLMLALKSVISTYTEFPTIIFDEIDTGISGQTAVKVGQLMKHTAANVQLIAITHLPQIAAMGNTHLKVSKITQHQNTETIVQELSLEERIPEIAAMLSGEKLTESSLKTAKELLEIK